MGLKRERRAELKRLRGLVREAYQRSRLSSGVIILERAESQKGASAVPWPAGRDVPLRDVCSALSEALDRGYEARTEAEHLRAQVERLAVVILEEIEGEPSRSEGAVDTAIRLLRAGEPARRRRVKRAGG